MTQLKNHDQRISENFSELCNAIGYGKYNSQPLDQQIMEKVEIRLMKTDGIMKACLDENLRLNAKNTTRLDNQDIMFDKWKKI